MPNRNRVKSFAVFIDLAKAFDGVNRVILLDKLRTRNISAQLRAIIQNMLTDTSINLNGEVILTLKGVPQAQ